MIIKKHMLRVSVCKIFTFFRNFIFFLIKSQKHYTCFFLAGKYHYIIIKVLITRGTLKQHIKKEEIKINNTQNNEK